MAKTALILGGGGALGISWETGVMAGLQEAGVDVTGAEDDSVLRFVYNSPGIFSRANVVANEAGGRLSNLSSGEPHASRPPDLRRTRRVFGV